MQIDVGACIADLLHEQQSVTIPGLGAFVTAHKPATIDAVEGKIVPPAKQISFNKNLLIDDGLLVKSLREKFHLSYGEAMRAVDEFAKSVKETIERREIVHFQAVGRLYKDFEQQYQFLPDGTNFNTDAFGLPALEYFPVGRPTAVKASPPPVKKSVVATSATQNAKNWVQQNLLLVSSAGVLVLTVSIYLLVFNQKEPPQEQEAAPPSITSRYNVGPSEEEIEAAENATNLTPAEEDTDESASESATLSPKQKYAVISIGLFANKENVERLIKKIYEEGYEPYAQKSGKGTRVGVQLKYDRSSELNETLRAIQKKFGTKAVILKR